MPSSALIPKFECTDIFTDWQFLDLAQFVHPSVDILVYYKILTEKWPKCCLIYWPTYRLYWLVECWSICWPKCRSIGYWHSADTSLILEYLVDCSLCCRHSLTQVRNVCGGAVQISLFCPRFSEASLYKLLYVTVGNWVLSPLFSSKQNCLLLSNMANRDNCENV